MIIDELTTILSRDIELLKAELNLYKKEENLWKLDGDITNAAGNLTLHLIGNLKHFIGAVLGKTGFERQREQEFELQNMPRAELIAQLEETRIVVIETLDAMFEEDLEPDFPVKVWDRHNNTGYFLIHLCTHLTYHLGQVNYHRRLLDN